MGADVMRWHVLRRSRRARTCNFGYGPADEVKRRLLTFWNSVAFFVTYANIEGFEPTCADLEAGPPASCGRSTAGCSRARSTLVARGDGRVRALLDARRRPRRSSVRRRPLELVHPPLAAALLGRRRGRAAGRSGRRSSQALRVIAPVMPFLAEHLWQGSCATSSTDAPTSVFLAGWPEPVERSPTRRCWPRSRRCGASSSSGARRAPRQRLKLRQPLRRLVVEGAPLARGPRGRDRATSCASRRSSSGRSRRPSCA